MSLLVCYDKNKMKHESVISLQCSAVSHDGVAVHRSRYTGSCLSSSFLRPQFNLQWPWAPQTHLYRPQAPQTHLYRPQAPQIHLQWPGTSKSAPMTRDRNRRHLKFTSIDRRHLKLTSIDRRHLKLTSIDRRHLKFTSNDQGPQNQLQWPGTATAGTSNSPLSTAGTSNSPPLTRDLPVRSPHRAVAVRGGERPRVQAEDPGDSRGRGGTQLLPQDGSVLESF